MLQKCRLSDRCYNKYSGCQHSEVIVAAASALIFIRHRAVVIMDRVCRSGAWYGRIEAPWELKARLPTSLGTSRVIGDCRVTDHVAPTKTTCQTTEQFPITVSSLHAQNTGDRINSIDSYFMTTTGKEWRWFNFGNHGYRSDLRHQH